MDVTRRQAIEILEDGHARIAELLARLPEEDLVRRGTIGGGEWSAKDLACHLASWEDIAVRALEDWSSGHRPWIETVFDDDNGVDRLNAENVEAWLAAPAATALERFETSYREVVEAIDATSDEAWASPAPYETAKPRTLGSFIGGILGAPDRAFGHAYAHLKELRAYVGSLATST